MGPGEVSGGEEVLAGKSFLKGDNMTCEVYKDAKGEWRWRVVNIRNGKTLADSGEGYKRRQHAVRMIAKLFPGMPVHEVIEAKDATKS